MPKAKKQPDGGPYLAAAMIVERMLVEVDRVPSAVRIVDAMTLSLPHDPPLTKDAVLATHLSLLVFFKAGEFRGKSQLNITLATPSGERATFLDKELDFSGAGVLPESGNNLCIGMHVKWDGPGLYWFDISLDDSPVTRVPFRIYLGKNETTEAGPKKQRGKTKA